MFYFLLSGQNELSEATQEPISMIRTATKKTRPINLIDLRLGNILNYKNKAS